MEDVIKFLNNLFPKFQDEYRGKLTIDQAAEGIEKVIENAEDLLDDSLILFKASKFPRSISLAIMAVEEVSKIEIIKKILLSNGVEGKIWKEFKNHKTKNHTWYFPVLKKFSVSNYDVKHFVGVQSDWVKRINDLKNYTLYLNANRINGGSDFEWNLPKTLIQKDFCGMFIVAAIEVVKDDRITWDSNSLGIFIKHWKLIDDEIRCEKPLLFYKELRDLKIISEDRYMKIVSNLNK